MIQFIRELIANKIKNKHLAKLKPNDNIVINIPKGFTVTVNGCEKSDYHCGANVIANDPIRKVLFIEIETVTEEEVMVIKYSSLILRNYMLFNVYSKGYVNLHNNSTDKEEIKKQMEIAVKNSNFEMAKLLNEKLKNLD